MADETEEERRRREAADTRGAVEPPPPTGLAPTEPLQGGPPPAQASAASVAPPPDEPSSSRYHPEDEAMMQRGYDPSAPRFTPGDFQRGDMGGQQRPQRLQPMVLAPQSPQQPPAPQVPDQYASLTRAQNAVAQATLSPAEHLRLARLQQGLNTIEEEAANGNIDTQTADQMRQRIMQQAQPLVVRQSELPALAMQLQYQQLQHQTAMMEGLRVQQEMHDATTAQGRLPQARITMPDGTQMSMYQNRDGNWHHIEPRQERPDNSEDRQQQRQLADHQRYVREATLEATRAYQHWQDQVQHARQNHTPPPPAPEEWMQHSDNYGPGGRDRTPVERRIAHLVADKHYINGTTPPPGTPDARFPATSQGTQGGPPAGPGSTRSEQQQAYDAILNQLGPARQATAPAPAPAPNAPPTQRTYSNPWDWWVNRP